MPDTASTEQTGQPVLDAIEEALLQGAASHAHRARNIARCIAEAGYEITPKPTRGDRPRGVFLEVLERTGDSAPDDDVILPSEVRLNGSPLLVAEDHPVTVEEVSAPMSESFVRATITLLCRRVVIEQRSGRRS